MSRCSKSGLLDGRLVQGWDSPALDQALDLCLSCKGCARDCPTGVDMATYKSQWLFERYRGRRRPQTHYTLGRLPALARSLSPRPRAKQLLGWSPRIPLCDGLKSTIAWFAAEQERCPVASPATAPIEQPRRQVIHRPADDRHRPGDAGADHHRLPSRDIGV